MVTWDWPPSWRAGTGVYSRELRLNQLDSLQRLCVRKDLLLCVKCILHFKSTVIKASASANSKLVIACQTRVGELNSVYSLNIMWVPSHSSIAVNESVIELDRKGASHDFIDPETVIPISKCWVKLQKLETTWKSVMARAKFCESLAKVHKSLRSLAKIHRKSSFASPQVCKSLQKSAFTSYLTSFSMISLIWTAICLTEIYAFFNYLC